MHKETTTTLETKKKQKRGFNNLTPSEWASLSKNVWNDLSSQRTKAQIEHGAVFPVKLAERLITIYSKEDDYIFDPFLGIGTTLIASQNLGRHALGIEINPHFAQTAEKWVNSNENLLMSEKRYKIINDDCRNLTQHVKGEEIQLTVTSPPYADFIRRSVADRKKTHKKSLIVHANNSSVKPYSDDVRDFGNLPYEKFMQEIENILHLNFKITKQGGYSVWIVKDYRNTEKKIPYVAVHSDLASAGERAGFKFQDLIVWDQTGQRRLVLLGFPSVFYTNQNCSFIVVFRKC